MDDMRIYEDLMKEWGKDGRPKDKRPRMPSMPRLLSLWLDCDQHGCLLEPGGYNDQPYLLWHLMQAAGHAYQEVMRFQAKVKGKANANPKPNR